MCFFIQRFLKAFALFFDWVAADKQLQDEEAERINVWEKRMKVLIVNDNIIFLLVRKNRKLFQYSISGQFPLHRIGCNCLRVY